MGSEMCIRDSYISFFDKLVGKPAVFVGLKNFIKLAEINYNQVLINTFIVFTFITVAIRMNLALTIAIILNTEFKGRRIMNVIFMLPYALPLVPVVHLFRIMYDPDWGVINQILRALGLIKSNILWLGHYNTAMMCAITIGVWRSTPFWAVVFLAAMKGIPEEFYEAAELEGARFGQKIWHITLPRLRPIISMLLLLAVIGNMQIFERPYVMTGGGPGMATTTVVMYFYQLSFQSLIFGKGASLAVILFFTILVLIIIPRNPHSKQIEED